MNQIIHSNQASTIARITEALALAKVNLEKGNY